MALATAAKALRETYRTPEIAHRLKDNIYQAILDALPDEETADDEQKLVIRRKARKYYTDLFDYAFGVRWGVRGRFNKNVPEAEAAVRVARLLEVAERHSVLALYPELALLSDDTNLIYTFLCGDGHTYTGLAKKGLIDNRLFRHDDGSACEVTRVHKPLRDCVPAIRIASGSPGIDETMETLEMMKRHGIHNSHGGVYCEPVLSPLDVQRIVSILDADKDACYNCGGTDHYLHSAAGMCTRVSEPRYMENGTHARGAGPTVPLQLGAEGSWRWGTGAPPPAPPAAAGAQLAPQLAAVCAPSEAPPAAPDHVSDTDDAADDDADDADGGAVPPVPPSPGGQVHLCDDMHIDPAVAECAPSEAPPTVTEHVSNTTDSADGAAHDAADDAASPVPPSPGGQAPLGDNLFIDPAVANDEGNAIPLAGEIRVTFRVSDSEGGFAMARVYEPAAAASPSPLYDREGDAAWFASNTTKSLLTLIDEAVMQHPPRPVCKNNEDESDSDDDGDIYCNYGAIEGLRNAVAISSNHARKITKSNSTFAATFAVKVLLARG